PPAARKRRHSRDQRQQVRPERALHPVRHGAAAQAGGGRRGVRADVLQPVSQARLRVCTSPRMHPFAPDDTEIADKIRMLEIQLAGPDLNRRREAAKGIYDLCYEVACSTATIKLDDLSRCRTAAAMPALLTCIADPDEEIGNSGEWGLKYCSPDSIEPLIG